MAKTKNQCPNCGDDVPVARWNAGYKYCKSKTCFEALGRRTAVFEAPPDPDTVDINPYDLEDVAAMYGEGE